ncbi:MAG: hypothetical protein V3U19_09535 [Thermodesulfobacteriota bacterium]
MRAWDKDVIIEKIKTRPFISLAASVAFILFMTYGSLTSLDTTFDWISLTLGIGIVLEKIYDERSNIFKKDAEWLSIAKQMIVALLIVAALYIAAVIAAVILIPSSPSWDSYASGMAALMLFGSLLLIFVLLNIIIFLRAILKGKIRSGVGLASVTMFFWIPILAIKHPHSSTFYFVFPIILGFLYDEWRSTK